jgi:hypothetical protein
MSWRPSVNDATKVARSTPKASNRRNPPPADLRLGVAEPVDGGDEIDQRTEGP